jgi:hypothetical protein
MGIMWAVKVVGVCELDSVIGYLLNTYNHLTELRPIHWKRKMVQFR